MSIDATHDMRTPETPHAAPRPSPTDWPPSVMRWVPFVVPIGAAILIGLMFLAATVA